MKERRPEQAWVPMARSQEPACSRRACSQRARELRARELREEEWPGFPQFFGGRLREPWQSHQGRLSGWKVRLAEPEHRPLQQEPESLPALARLRAVALARQRAVALAPEREPGQA